MVTRSFWTNKIKMALASRSVLWLSGVRRAGKTMLCKGLDGAIYFDCELPRVRRQMDDPEGFLAELKGKTVILDEVHRLANPSEILKIAADHYPDTKVIATGSSSLGASAKFRDTLTGRKNELWLSPMIHQDLSDFGGPDLGLRFIKGGLPPFFLAEEISEQDYQEWMDSFWAKDIQELFRLERRHSFLRFAELLISQSSGIFEASGFAGRCEVSRTTITNYLSVLEAAYLVHIIRPFSSRRSTEIVSAPKIYAFDTGFVCYHRGWNSLRQDDMGLLWEHYVLNEILAQTQRRTVYYWRDKQKHEVDFIISDNRQSPVAVECKWKAADFDPSNLRIFRRIYPEGSNYVVAQDITKGFIRHFGNIRVKFMSLQELTTEL